MFNIARRFVFKFLYLSIRNLHLAYLLRYISYMFACIMSIFFGFVNVKYKSNA